MKLAIVKGELLQITAFPWNTNTLSATSCSQIHRSVISSNAFFLFLVICGAISVVLMRSECSCSSRWDSISKQLHTENWRRYLQSAVNFKCILALTHTSVEYLDDPIIRNVIDEVLDHYREPKTTNFNQQSQDTHQHFTVFETKLESEETLSSQRHRLLVEA